MTQRVIDLPRHEGQFRSQTAAHAGPGACALIPAGGRRHVRNPGAGPLFFLSVYAPPAS